MVSSAPAMNRVATYATASGRVTIEATPSATLQGDVTNSQLILLGCAPPLFFLLFFSVGPFGLAVLPIATFGVKAALARIPTVPVESRHRYRAATGIAVLCASVPLGLTWGLVGAKVIPTSLTVAWDPPVGCIGAFLVTAPPLVGAYLVQRHAQGDGGWPRVVATLFLTAMVSCWMALGGAVALGSAQWASSLTGAHDVCPVTVAQHAGQGGAAFCEELEETW
ncbi:MAG: hypothetical protein JWM86_159 [Thermoleophilia bacterium]|nr:hypothetical protein [Thermoleophilia bacterium]